MLELLFDGPKRAAVRLVLAHGAGAGMESPFMREFAQGIAARGVRVVRFEFPYMQRRRSGVRPGPDRPAVLMDTWRAVVGQLGDASTLVIGGKSMGGRIASMLADELGVRRLVCLGYPFHPALRPDKLRTAHLETLRTPCLIVQGTRDRLGTRDEVPGYRLSRRIRIVWIEDGDHSFVTRRRLGFAPEAALQAAMDAVAAFVVPAQR
jgi:predicted alpha/beta-hydrolase family hydrolase